MWDAAKSDNSHLQVGSKVAILMVGLTKSITPAVTLPAFKQHVVQALGKGVVDVFVHTSPLFRSGADKDSLARERQEIRDMYEELLGKAALKAIVVTDSRFENTPRTVFVSGEDPTPVSLAAEERIHAGNLPRFWEHHLRVHQHSLVWFYSLRHLFRLVLREEALRHERYSHVIRMRTDVIWLSSWANYSFLRAHVPPLSSTVAAAPTEGQLFVDHFWIAARGAARRAFVDMPYAMEMPVDRREMYEAFGCTWDAKLMKELHYKFGHATVEPSYDIDSLPLSEHDVIDGKVYGKTLSLDMYNSTEDACYVSVLGPHSSNGIYAEALVKFWLLRFGVRFLACCALTGEFVHSGTREVFLRACTGPRECLDAEDEILETEMLAAAGADGGKGGRAGKSFECVSRTGRDSHEEYRAAVERHKHKVVEHWHSCVFHRQHDKDLLRAHHAMVLGHRVDE